MHGKISINIFVCKQINEYWGWLCIKRRDSQALVFFYYYYLSLNVTITFNLHLFCSYCYILFSRRLFLSAFLFFTTFFIGFDVLWWLFPRPCQYSQCIGIFDQLKWTSGGFFVSFFFLLLIFFCLISDQAMIFSETFYILKFVIILTLIYFLNSDHFIFNLKIFFSIAH